KGLMFVCIQDSLAHAGHEFSEWSRCRPLAAQRQEVDALADEDLVPKQALARRRNANYNLVLLRQAPQKHLICSEQGYKQCSPMPRTSLPHGSAKLGIDQ